MLGEIVGWFIGWDLLLEYTAIVAVVAIGISGYFNYLLAPSARSPARPGCSARPARTGGGLGATRSICSPSLLCLLIAYLLNLGMRAPPGSRRRWSFLKVAVVLLVIVVGFFYIKPGNYNPFFPFGFGGALTGAATVFFAVFGYDAMSTAAEESKDAQRHMPKAIMYSLGISMVLYVLACLVLTGMQKYTDIDPKSGVLHRVQVGRPVRARRESSRSARSSAS